MMGVVCVCVCVEGWKRKVQFNLHVVLSRPASSRQSPLVGMYVLLFAAELAFQKYTICLRIQHETFEKLQTVTKNHCW